MYVEKNTEIHIQREVYNVVRQYVLVYSTKFIGGIKV